MTERGHLSCSYIIVSTIKHLAEQTFSEYSNTPSTGTSSTAEKVSSDLCRNTSESTPGFWGGDDYGLES